MPEPTTYDKVLAGNIRAARGRANLSQAEVAARMKALGFTQVYGATIGAIERADRRATASEIAGLALCFETTPSALVRPPLAEVRQVRFGDHLIPAQRLWDLDDSVTWDGNDLKITPPTVQHRPVDLALADEQDPRIRAVIKAFADELHRREPGEYAPLQPDDQTALDLPAGWRPPKPPESDNDREEDHGQDQDS
jgi:transcriptional regulator with XRE-family HTH domain